MSLSPAPIILKIVLVIAGQSYGAVSLRLFGKQNPYTVLNLAARNSSDNIRNAIFAPLFSSHSLYGSLEQTSIALNPRSLAHLLRCQAYTHVLLGSEYYSCSQNNTQHYSLARSCFEMPRRN